MTIKEDDKDKGIDILISPGKYGYQICSNCDGYGDMNGGDLDTPKSEYCSVCGGDGVVPGNDGTTCSILEEMGITKNEGGRNY